MRFIRDIIAEKSQAAGQADGAALRYPLLLREQDRADVAEEPTPTVHIEAEPAQPASDAAALVAPQPPEPAEAPVDLSAISAALTAAPVEAPVEPDMPEPEAPSDPFGNLFAEEAQEAVSYPHLRAHETKANLVCRLLLAKKQSIIPLPARSRCTRTESGFMSSS